MTRLGPLLIGYTRTTTTTYPSNIRVGRKEDSRLARPPPLFTITLLYSNTHNAIGLLFRTEIYTMLLDCYSGLKYSQCYWSAIQDWNTHNAIGLLFRMTSQHADTGDFILTNSIHIIVLKGEFELPKNIRRNNPVSISRGVRFSYCMAKWPISPVNFAMQF